MILKRLILVLALLAGFVSPASAVGTIGYSLSQQFDANGNVLAGCQFYTIVAGTTSTPQNAFQDTGLTIPWPNPMTCDASGRLPQFFLADGQIKIRLTDKNGVTQVVADNILVIGPSSGGGGGGAVDPTTVLATGDFKAAYGTGPINGFVRCNGRTIGSATSGATERANADTQALFIFLWTNDPNLAVSGGRGASGLADFTANKTITAPDCRSRALAGLGDMGNTDNALYSGVTFSSGNSTTLGSILGAARRTLVASQIPTITSTVTSGTASVSGSVSGTVSVSGPNGHTVVVDSVASSNNAGGGSNAYFTGGVSTNAAVFSGSNSMSGSMSGTITGSTSSNNTSGQPHDTVSPRILTTIYIKL